MEERQREGLVLFADAWLDFDEKRTSFLAALSFGFMTILENTRIPFTSFCNKVLTGKKCINIYLEHFISAAV